MKPVPRNPQPVSVESRPNAKPRPAWTLALSYFGSNFDAEAPWQSGGHLGVDLRWPVGAWLGLSLNVPAPVRLDDAPRTDVWRLPILLAGGFRFRPDARVQPGVGLGLVLEPLWWRAESAPQTVGVSGSTARIGASPLADVRVRIVGGFGVHARVRADVWVLNAELVVEDATARLTRLSPHPVSAVLEAGVHHTF